MSPNPWTWLFLLAAVLLSGCAHTPSSELIEPERKVVDELVSEAAPTRDDVPADQPSEAPKPRALTIALGAQQFTYAEDGEVVRIGPISSGAEGYPTPKGRFSVRSKDKDKVSSRYTNQIDMQAWMPYAIQFHGHYFLHEGWLPGYPDSHGCVRLGEKDARFLFEQMQPGDPIEVVN